MATNRTGLRSKAAFVTSVLYVVINSVEETLLAYMYMYIWGGVVGLHVYCKKQQHAGTATN